MEIQFENYRFLPDQLVLYCDGSIVPLKRNQAVLLDFFLSNADAIHSKDAILDSVWKDKVVSEQVVFQTISQLRSIFGSHAIQTFSKKGYKWQIPFSQVNVLSTATPTLTPTATSSSLDSSPLSAQLSSQISSSSQSIESEQAENEADVSTNEPEAVRGFYVSKLSGTTISALFIMVLFIVSLVTYLKWNSNESTIAHKTESKPVPETALPTDLSKVVITWVQDEDIVASNQINAETNGSRTELKLTSNLVTAINNTTEFQLETMSPKTSVTEFLSSPKHLWSLNRFDNNKWLLRGELLKSAKGLFLKYALTTGAFTWRGYVFGQDRINLETNLVKRLQDLNGYGLFELQGKLELGRLLNLHKRYPNDAELTLLLAKAYLNAQQEDVAFTYLEQLGKNTPDYAHRPYQALALYRLGKAFKETGQYDLAQHRFNVAEKVLEDTPLISLKQDLLGANAWLAYARGDTKSMFAVLEAGFTVLPNDSNPLGLFEWHILYSILAEKTGHHSKKYDHLNEAQALLLQHNLNDSNLAIVYYHFALFNKENGKVMPYLDKIKALPRTANNYWVKDQAFEFMVNNYIESGAFEKAHDLFDTTANTTSHAPLTSAVKMMLKAEVYQAENKVEKAKALFEKAFNLARIQYDIYTGLRAAYGLYLLTQDQPKVQAEYWAYLEKNAEESWLKQRNLVLANSSP